MNKVVVDFGCAQDIGARPEQQDFFAVSEPTMESIVSDKGFYAVVADGMGGHQSGARASLLAVQAFMDEYVSRTFAEPIPSALHRSITGANSAVYSENAKREDSDMGTTLVGFVIQDMKLHWVSAGDSRLYLYRAGQLERVNKEHSYGAELDEKLRRNEISLEHAQAESKKRHMLTSYLGIREINRIDLAQSPVQLNPGDRIMACSDGLYTTLSDAEITDVMRQDISGQQKCDELLQRVKAKAKPRQDNVTIVLLELNREMPRAATNYVPPVRARQPRRSGAKTLLLVLLAVCVLAGGGYGAYSYLMPGDAPETADGGSAGAGGAAPLESTAGLDPCAIQNVLLAKGYYQGELDGILGENTSKALRIYQAREALPVSGAIDGATKAKLNDDIQAMIDAGALRPCGGKQAPPAVGSTTPAQDAAVKKAQAEKAAAEEARRKAEEQQRKAEEQQLELDRQKAQLQRERNALAAEKDKAKRRKAYEAQQDEVEGRLRALAERIEVVNIQIRDADAVIAEAEQTVKETEAAFGPLNEQLEAAKQALEGKKAALKSLESRSRALEASIAELTDRMADQDINQMELTKMRREKEGLEQDKIDNAAAIVGTKSELASATQAVTQGEQAIKDAQAAKAKAEKDLVGYRSQREVLGRNLESFRNTERAMSNESALIQAEMNKL